MNSLKKRLVLITLVISGCLLKGHSASSSHKRQQRGFPLFYVPRGGVLNFVCGFGIPVEDLRYETVLSGIVFKSQHFLPAKPLDLTTFKPVKVNGRNFAQTTVGNTSNAETLEDFSGLQSPDFSKYRWFLYQALEQLIANMTRRFSARVCLLRTICEAASVSFANDGGLLGEILHVILTPSLSADTIAKHSDNEYFVAEQMGRDGADCATIFHECRISMLDEFSKIFHTN